MLAIGSEAPEFSLKDQNGKTVKLSRFQGKRVLLSFRPLAWKSLINAAKPPCSASLSNSNRHSSRLRGWRAGRTFTSVLMNDPAMSMVNALKCTDSLCETESPP